PAPSSMYGRGIWRCNSGKIAGYWQWTLIPGVHIWAFTTTSPGRGMARAGRSSSTITDAGRFPVFFDRGYDTEPGRFAGIAPNNPGEGWHGGKLNTVFADNSARSLKREELMELFAEFEEYLEGQ